MKTTKTFSLEADTVDILDRVGNRGRYIDLIVQRSNMRLRMALDELKENGWKPGEILAAVRSLNMAWADVTSPNQHASTMERCGAHDIKPARWAGMVNAVRDELYNIGFSIDIVACEYWCGNEMARTMIEGGVR